MIVALIGSGGREHAICELLKRSKKVNKIYCFPGNAGTSKIANNVNIDANNFEIFKDYILKNKIELVVLAKYMQILSSEFLSEFSQIINIHHSFLPAFKGAQPYHQAWDRGVKIIGATAHYVTKDLDAGPIIEQTIAHVSHRDMVSDLIRKGRDSERIALARALRLHLCRQVMVYQGRTAVFA